MGLKYISVIVMIHFLPGNHYLSTDLRKSWMFWSTDRNFTCF